MSIAFVAEEKDAEAGEAESGESESTEPAFPELALAEPTKLSLMLHEVRVTGPHPAAYRRLISRASTPETKTVLQGEAIKIFMSRA